MKFLFTSNPLLGHLLPMVPLIRAARAAGHEVIVATGSDLRTAVRRHGFPLWLVGPRFAEVRAELLAAAGTDDLTAIEPLLRHTVLFAQPGVIRARQLRPMVAAWRPDVVVHELAEFAGWEAAAASGALDVVHGWGSPAPYVGELAQRVCRVAAEQLGTPNRATAVLSTPYLDPCPPRLRAPGAPFRDPIPIRPEVGAVYPGERLPEALLQPPYRRTIYLTLGTAFNAPEAWAMALAAVRELPVNVIATVGDDQDPARFGPLPGHIAVTRYVPQALIMRQVDAVVFHGGSGTMLGSVAEGKPMVSLPMGADQFANSEQIVRSGAGLVVGPAQRTPGVHSGRDRAGPRLSLLRHLGPGAAGRRRGNAVRRTGPDGAGQPRRSIPPAGGLGLR